MLRSILMLMCLILTTTAGFAQVKKYQVVADKIIYNTEYTLNADGEVQIVIWWNNYKTDKQVISIESYDKFKNMFESYISNLKDTTGNAVASSDTNNLFSNFRSAKIANSIPNTIYEKDIAEFYSRAKLLPTELMLESANNQINEVAGRVVLKKEVIGELNTGNDKDTTKEIKAKVIDANIACVNNMIKADFALEGFRDRLSLKYPISTKTKWTDMYVFGEKRNPDRQAAKTTYDTTYTTATKKIKYTVTIKDSTIEQVARTVTTPIIDSNYRIIITLNGNVVRISNLIKNKTEKRDTTYLPRSIQVITRRAGVDSLINDTTYLTKTDTVVNFSRAPFTTDTFETLTRYFKDTTLLTSIRNVQLRYNKDTLVIKTRTEKRDSIQTIVNPKIDSTTVDATEDYLMYKFRISDLLEFIPDTVSNRKYYNWKSFDSKQLKAGGNTLVYKKNWLAEAINLTAFYDILTQVQAADANRNNDVPLQMELNLNIPIRDWNASRSTFWFPKMQTDVNFVPAGSKTGPYHLLDSANLYRSGKRSINFELLRDHNLNLATKLTVFRAMPTVKEFMFFDLNLGYRCFVTSIKTRDLLSTKNTGATGDSTFAGPTVAATSFIIGPELSLRYECVIDEWFGLDVNFGVNYLRRAVGVKRDVENLLEDYKYPNGKYYSRDMWTLSPEINMYFRIPGKKDLNPSGFMVRYRMYQDIGSVANPVHWILVGYSANLKTLFK